MKSETNGFYIIRNTNYCLWKRIGGELNRLNPVVTRQQKNLVKRKKRGVSRVQGGERLEMDHRVDCYERAATKGFAPPSKGGRVLLLYRWMICSNELQ